MNDNQIYIEAEPKIIKEVLELVRDRIGSGVDIVDLNPNSEWDKK